MMSLASLVVVLAISCFPLVTHFWMIEVAIPVITAFACQKESAQWSILATAGGRACANETVVPER